MEANGIQRVQETEEVQLAFTGPASHTDDRLQGVCRVLCCLHCFCLRVKHKHLVLPEDFSLLPVKYKIN